MKLRAAVIAFGPVLAAPALAQESGPPPAEKPAQPSTPDPKPTPLPSLDELLGLPSPAKPSTRPPAADPAQAALDRQLSPAEAAEQFRQAVDLMDQTARRITESRDLGLSTQRLQEDAVRKLDMLIKAAEQQARQSRSRSASSASQRQRDQTQQPNQQRGSREDSRGENRDEIMPPGRQDGPLNPELAARGAAWGALPARVRDALLQGNQDRFSALYQRLTEAYYRRLAEEAR